MGRHESAVRSGTERMVSLECAAQAGESGQQPGDDGAASDPLRWSLETLLPLCDS